VSGEYAMVKAASANGWLDELNRPSAWPKLLANADLLVAGLRSAAEAAHAAVSIQQAGTMFTIFFSPSPVTNWASASKADTARYAAFFNAMLEGGVYLPPSQFESSFLSTAHQEAEISQTLIAAQRAFAIIPRQRET
jgi:glutamate-1-semialdehyde 2,1-aminomutase